MLRVAIVGMGPIGNLHADCYQEFALSELVGVCDINKERADAASKRLGVPAFYDAGEMLAQLQPDICGITTGGYEYSSDHYEPTMQAFEAGCNVLGEKPISNEIDKAEEMVALARKKGLRYGVNLNHRFTPLARKAKNWVDEGRLGDLLFINMAMWIKNPVESSPWFHLKALHPHTVDVMRYYCGDITHVQCFAIKGPGRSIWSTAHFNMQFANGVVGGLTGSYDIERGHPMERCEVAGTDGRFVLEDMFDQLTLYPAGSAEKTVITNTAFGPFSEKTFADTFRNRIQRFVEQVFQGVPPKQIDGSGADALAAQKILAAAIESVQEGTVVEVK
ncbi:MAG: Gfo/Idh/MocA family oxidoreductase [Nitrospiraceae bacterium]|nr:Gfo/Idh/MocA family oxidoreductase [Nitrospiraceae bacterium]